MADIDNIIEARDKKSALDEGHERRQVEAAQRYMVKEDAVIGFLCSGWCQAALPHRALPAPSSGSQISGELEYPTRVPGITPASH